MCYIFWHLIRRHFCKKRTPFLCPILVDFVPSRFAVFVSLASLARVTSRCVSSSRSLCSLASRHVSRPFSVSRVPISFLQKWGGDALLGKITSFFAFRGPSPGAGGCLLGKITILVSKSGFADPISVSRGIPPFLQNRGGCPTGQNHPFFHVSGPLPPFLQNRGGYPTGQN